MTAPPAPTGKSSTLLGALSLAANVTLFAAALFWWPKRETSGPARMTAATSGEGPDTRPLRDGTLIGGSPEKTWDRLRADGLPTLAARLRTAGFPPSILRAVFGALVEEQFAPRRRAIKAASEKPFWKGRDNGPDPKGQAELNTLGFQQRDLLRQLLGDLDDETDLAVIRQEFGHDLPPEKLPRFRILRRNYEELLSQAQMKLDQGTNLREDEEKMRQLQDAMHTDLAKILSPNELLEYDLRNSDSASRLRSELGALHASEAEFRALFPLYRALDEQFPPKNGLTPPEETASRDAAVAQMQEQFKALLGPDRYAEYQLSRNYDYQQTAKITERLNLPDTATVEVYAVQRDIQQRANALRSNRTLSPGDRTTQLTALASEASTKISGVLGPSGFEAYQQYSGRWLQRLQPNPRTNAKTP